jgi:hypothetical protein
MFRAILFCAAALVASAASAQRIYNLPAGQYLVTGEVRAVGPVINPSGPVVPPDGPVVPPVVSDFSKAVVAAVNTLPVSDKRHIAATKLTATYQMLAGQIKDGKIHPTQAVKAAELICPIALGADGKDWSGVFTVVNAAVAKAGTPADCAGVFDSAATAVLSTAPASSDGTAMTLAAAAEQYGIDWNAFLAFLMQLLTLLLPLLS